MSKYNFPKIDLHLHLDGAFRFDTIWELYNAQSVQMPFKTLDEYKAFIKESANSSEVNKYLRMFDDPQKVMQDKESISRITYELIEDLHNQGLVYAEIRFAPQFHTAKGLSQFEATEAVLEGRNKALEKYKDIRVNIIACMMALGDVNINEKENWETVEVANKYKDKGLCAIDLAGAEGLTPLSNYGKFFKKAKEYGLNMTCHAGDSQWSDTLRDAIDFGVTRIGHGHHIYFDQKLMSEAVLKNITLEVCPTSNIQCTTEPSYKEHPLKKLYDSNVLVTVNTDNPTLAGITLDDEYDHCINDMGFTYNDLLRMNINSIKASFVEDEFKLKVIDELESKIKEN